jgi:hypothetical protein
MFKHMWSWKSRIVNQVGTYTPIRYASEVELCGTPNTGVQETMQRVVVGGKYREFDAERFKLGSPS